MLEQLAQNSQLDFTLDIPPGTGAGAQVKSAVDKGRPGTRTYSSTPRAPIAAVVVLFFLYSHTCRSQGCPGASLYLPSGYAEQIVVLVARFMPANSMPRTHRHSSGSSLPASARAFAGRHAPVASRLRGPAEQELRAVCIES